MLPSCVMFYQQLDGHLSALSFLFSHTRVCWTVLLSQPLSLTVSSGSLYYSSPPLPGYLYQLLQSVCLSALLAASVYTNTNISTCVCNFGLPLTSWPETASLQIPEMNTVTPATKGILLPQTGTLLYCEKQHFDLQNGVEISSVKL